METVILPKEVDTIAGSELVIAEIDAARRLGRTLREWRKKAELTQEQLAKKLDVSQSWVSQVESGKLDYSPSIAFAARYAHVCGQTLAFDAARESHIRRELPDDTTGMSKVPEVGEAKPVSERIPGPAQNVSTSGLAAMSGVSLTEFEADLLKKLATDNAAPKYRRRASGLQFGQTGFAKDDVVERHLNAATSLHSGELLIEGNLVSTSNRDLVSALLRGISIGQKMKSRAIAPRAVAHEITANIVDLLKQDFLLSGASLAESFQMAAKVITRFGEGPNPKVTSPDDSDLTYRMKKKKKAARRALER